MRLEVLRVGGTKFTSVEVLQPFFEALTGPGRGPTRAEAGARPRAAARPRQRDEAAIEAELEEMCF